MYIVFSQVYIAMTDVSGAGENDRFSVLRHNRFGLQENRHDVESRHYMVLDDVLLEKAVTSQSAEEVRVCGSDGCVGGNQDGVRPWRRKARVSKSLQ